MSDGREWKLCSSSTKDTLLIRNKYYSVLYYYSLEEIKCSCSLYYGLSFKVQVYPLEASAL